MKTDARVGLRFLSVAAIAILVFGIFALLIVPFNLATAQEEGLTGQEKEIEAQIRKAEENPPDVEALGKELEGATKQDTSTTGGGGGLGDKLAAGCGWFSLRPTCIVYWILDTITDFFTTLLVSLASSIFDQFINISLYDLSAMPFVKLGFRITLGVANMFFVLILLWIAIATIFNFEPYTARSLLLKLIIAALLINFSLAIGSAFIRMSNGIAMIFYKELQKPFEAKITGKLIQFPGTSIAQRVMLMSNFAAIKDTTPKGRATVDELDRVIREGKCEEIKEVVLHDDLGELVTTGVNCSSAQAEAAWRQRFATPENSSDTIATALSAIFWKLAITPILIFALLAGSIFLLIRQLSLAFILILGPLAFLFMILPATQRFYSDWWERLFKWSFFFPAFMFFLFISLQVGGGLLPEDLKSSDQRLDITFQYLMTIALLLGSLMAANQMGIYGAGTINKWGKGIAGAAGKWAKGTGKILGGKALEPILKSAPAQAMASSRYTRWALRPIEAGIQAGTKVSEQREKARIARRAAAVTAAGITDVNATLRGMRNDEERVKFMKELRKTDRLAFEAAVQNVALPLMQSTYQEAQRRHEDELAEQLVTAARDFDTRLEIITGLNRVHQDFQRMVNAQLAVMKSEMLQRIVSADDIRDATGAMNPHLQEALLNAIDIDAFRALGNTAEKAGRLSEFFGDQLGGLTAYASALAANLNEHQARMAGVDRAITTLQQTNEELANQLARTPAVRINLAYGRPLARRASAIPVAGLPPPAPATP